MKIFGLHILEEDFGDGVQDLDEDIGGKFIILLKNLSCIISKG